MYLQDQYYRANWSNARNATTKLDLPKSGILSWILLNITCAQAAGAPYQSAATGKWRIVDEISDVSVVANGRADIISVPGRIAQYLAFLDQGVTAYDKLREYSAASQECQILVNFGRHLWDEKYALDLGAFDSVELQLANTMTSTYWADDIHVDVHLGWFRGTGGPDGHSFFTKELWREYTTAQDGREYLELPTGRNIRRIGLQADPPVDSTYGTCDTAPNNLMYDLKLTLQNGVTTVFDGDLLELMVKNYYERGAEQLVHGANYHTADYGWNVGLGDVRGFAAIAGARDGGVATSPPTREGDLSHPNQKLENYEADSPVDYIARGVGYHTCAHFPFDRLPDMGDLLNPAKDADGIVELEIHTRDSSSAASGTNRVFLDRFATVRDIQG
jgi:hypothetical protein